MPLLPKREPIKSHNFKIRRVRARTAKKGHVFFPLSLSHLSVSGFLLQYLLFFFFLSLSLSISAARLSPPLSLYPSPSFPLSLPLSSYISSSFFRMSLPFLSKALPLHNSRCWRKVEGQHKEQKWFRELLTSFLQVFDVSE